MNVVDLLYEHVVFLVETGTSFFLDVTKLEWEGLQQILKHAKSAIWVTNGGLLSGREPLHAMISGIVRGLKTENSQRRISVLDLDHPSPGILPEASCDAILTLLYQNDDESNETYNLEYRYKDGVMYASSLQIDDALNDARRSRSKPHTESRNCHLKDFDNEPLKLTLNENNSQPSILFTDDQDFLSPLPDDHLEISVKAIGVDHNVSTPGFCHQTFS